MSLRYQSPRPWRSTPIKNGSSIPEKRLINCRSHGYEGERHGWREAPLDLIYQSSRASVGGVGLGRPGARPAADEGLGAAFLNDAIVLVQELTVPGDDPAPATARAA